MNQPIGNSNLGPLFLRVSIGLYFLLAGMRKIDNIQTFISIVEEHHVLPKQLAQLYGILVPYLEVGSGFFLLIGFWTTLGGLLSSLLLTSYIIAIGIFPYPASELFNKDIIILSGTICLMYTGAGAFSIDKFRKGD